MRTARVWLLGSLMLAACADEATTTSTTHPPETSSPPTAQNDRDLASSEKNALDALTEKYETRFAVAHNAEHKTLSHLAPLRRGLGKAVLKKQSTIDDASRMTLEVLAQHKDLFGMRDPASELAHVHAIVDELSMTHVRFSQMERGVPVIGGDLAAHYDADGRITSIQGRYVPDLAKLAIEPKITETDARAFATRDPSALVATNMVGRPRSVSKGAAIPQSAPRLVIFAAQTTAKETTTTPPRLAWEVVVRESSQYWTVSVDAESGEVIDRLSMSKSIKGSGVGVKGDTKALECSPSEDNANVFFLIDKSRPASIDTGDLLGGTDLEKAVFVSSTNTTSWDTKGASPGQAVDAHVGIGLIYDFFKKTLGRKGWDDKDGRELLLVHDGGNVDNAQFEKFTNTLRFGDPGELTSPSLAGSIDVVAHEFTHAVTDTTSALRYEAQSGALNEAMSDIFGAIVEHEVRPDPVNNWLIGEGFIKGDKAIRDMIAPGSVKIGPQPGHMKELVNTQQDFGGVHINSGIINKVAHLITVGGTHPVSNVTVTNPIGWEKMAKLFYRANQRYLLASSDFALAAKATMEAGADLKFTETELNTVDCAWKASGVVQGECVTVKSAPPAPSVPADGGDGAKKDPVDTKSSEEDKPAPTKSSTKSAAEADDKLPATSSGCSTSRSSSGSSSLLLVIAAAMLVRRRRQRSA